MRTKINLIIKNLIKSKEYIDDEEDRKIIQSLIEKYQQQITGEFEGSYEVLLIESQRYVISRIKKVICKEFGFQKGYVSGYDSYEKSYKQVSEKYFNQKKDLIRSIEKVEFPKWLKIDIIKSQHNSIHSTVLGTEINKLINIEIINHYRKTKQNESNINRSA